MSDPTPKFWRCTLSAPVIIPGLALILLLLGLCAFDPTLAEGFFSAGQAWIGARLSWYYVLVVAAFLLFLVILASSPYGDIRLGPDDATPEYSYPSWLAMLFAAGMGIGLLYFGVAEPVMHFSSPATAVGGTPAAAREALVTTFFHWGLHAWAIYATVGLALAYFGFRYNLPLTIRSALYPLLRHRINGPVGHAVDVFALVCTVFGIATTLGYGVLQLSAGLHRLTGMETSSPAFRYVTIAAVISLAGISAATGVGRGVKRLSEFNLLLAIGLMLFVLFAGPTSVIMQSFTENLGAYFSDIVGLSFRTFAYADEAKKGWLSGWTIVYWAWWISWSPFVGLFIARISRGRTIREFVLGVLLVPSAFNFLWMSVFGNGAIWFDTHGAAQALSSVASNADALLFNFLDLLPGSGISSGVAVLLIIVFFVTSADSGALVLDGIASKGRDDSPVWQRLMWAVILGLSAALLMSVGGLKALQSMTLIAALPFSLIILASCLGLWRALIGDHLHSSRELSPATSFWNGSKWRDRLDHLLRLSTPDEARAFIQEVAEPALRELAGDLQARGKPARIDSAEDGSISLTVPRRHARDFVYGVRPQTRTLSRLNPLRKEERSVTEPVTFFEDGRAGYDVQYMSHDEIIADVLRQYERYLQLGRLSETGLLNSAPGHVEAG
ncbi:BCCT family transporter [Uliginosibacterium paludis]|uniref:BCCT family transporter n=1 Tax=Uliginosibacterium paludis TaxID=1615952 RepID=A0ABV2CLU4_9RHOO